MIQIPVTRMVWLTSAALLLGSCGKKQQESEAGQQASPEALIEVCGEVFRDTDFSPWMSRAELKHLQSETVEGQFFSHVQGRCRMGLNEYRALVRPFPSDEYSQWAVFWGLTETEVYDWESKLLAQGFKRHGMQLFRGASGDVQQQMVWLKSISQAMEPENPMSESAEAPDMPPAMVREPSSTEEEPMIDLGAGAGNLVQPEHSVSAAVPPPTAVPVPEAELTGPSDESPNPPPGAVPVVQPPDSEDSSGSVPSQSLGAVPVVPVAMEPPSANENSTRPPQPTAKIERKVHRVVKGETLSKIAKSRKVTIQALKDANQLKSDDLKIGQELLIPAR